MAPRSPFSSVGGLKPARSLFDLSYTKKFDCDFGQLIPIYLEEMVPGDKFTLGNQIVIRFQPMVAPILHEIDVYTHYFYVPYRVLQDRYNQFLDYDIALGDGIGSYSGMSSNIGSFEDFISGGVDNATTATVPMYWQGTGNYYKAELYTLIDYLGFPLTDGGTVLVESESSKPVIYPFIAYNVIWYDWYRDENLQSDEYIASLYSDGNFYQYVVNNDIRNRSWKKDYFTSALESQQRGTPPSLPVNVSGTADLTSDSGAWSIGSLYTSGLSARGVSATISTPLSVTASVYSGLYESSTDGGTVLDTGSTSGISTSNSMITSLYGQGYSFDGASLDITNVSSFDVSDIRLAFQLQKWQERNMRAGVRYTEFLQSHFGVHPRDERLQRAEYIGGTHNSVIVSEVLQTSSTDSTSPQGNLAGHALSAGQGNVGSYYATEFGLVMGIMSVMPKLNYSCQGINRRWLRHSRYDFYFPEFAHLSEQAIYERELYFQAYDSSADINNDTIFGYQGIYNEMRWHEDEVVAGLRDTFDYWHMARKFSSPPQLNSDFITCDSDADDLKRPFAVQDEMPMIVEVGNYCKALRPLPVIGEPGIGGTF